MIGDFLQSVARIGLGAYWLYFASQKWSGVSWVHPLIVAAGAQNPVPGVHELLVRVVTPNWFLFAEAQTAGETLAGALLVLGLATRWAAGLAVLLSVGLSLSIAFTIPDLGLRWLYYLAVFTSLAVAVNGPGSLALERLLPVPRWLRS
jgi:uncharacterized membrane protein YphA (DoxX/SURF4 family)